MKRFFGVAVLSAVLAAAGCGGFYTKSSNTNARNIGFAQAQLAEDRDNALRIERGEDPIHVVTRKRWDALAR